MSTAGNRNLRGPGRLRAAQVFNSFGCSGNNVSPALAWSNVPAGTKSFALLAFDPDAPPGVVQGRTDYGTAGYGGPCPPPGKPHHYYFLYGH